MAIIEIISYAAGEMNLRGWPGERWIESIDDQEGFAITFKSVTEKRTDCFVIILTAAYRIYYREVMLWGTMGPHNKPTFVEENVVREWSTTLWTEDFQFDFIKGENLHNAMMGQLAMIQEAVDGYLKEGRIEERASGPNGDSGVLKLMNRDLVKTLDPDWNPSE